MHDRSYGLWLIGACGGVGTSAALGLAALQRRLIDPTSLVTALPLMAPLELPDFGQLVIGGHEIRKASFHDTVRDLQRRSGIFPTSLVELCQDELQRWQANIRPGTVLNVGNTIAGLADRAEILDASSPKAAIEHIQTDLRTFLEKYRLDDLVVVNVASTEPPFEIGPEHHTLESLTAALEQNAVQLPASSLYAWAALDLGLPYVNFTPSLGASTPALLELARRRGAVVAGKDAKTGETLLKTVLAPMFALRNWQILSWVGHNIFGNRDGLVLDDPQNKASKVRTKDQVVGQIVGYKPQTHVSIEYIESLDDWKTAWDHIHFRGFLDVKMTLQFIWQGCDSILAAPLVLDLARLALFAHKRGETGVLRHLASFFKNPMDVAEHDFFKQFAMLAQYVRAVAESGPIGAFIP